MELLVLVQNLLEDCDIWVDACEVKWSHVACLGCLLGERLSRVLLVKLIELEHVDVELVKAIHLMLKHGLDQVKEELAVASARDDVHLVIEEVVLVLENLGHTQLLVEFRSEISEEELLLEPMHSEVGHLRIIAEATIFSMVKERVVTLSIASGHLDLPDSGSVGFVAHLALLNQIEQVRLALGALVHEELL